MTRRRYIPDHQNRQRRITTAREIRQADEIAALKSELRALRRDRASPPRVTPLRRKPTADSYGAFLDHIGAQLTRLIDKGRTYFDSCPTCGNVNLPCMDPLIELERMEYQAGELDQLIFAPELGAGPPSA
ncbi:MAG: hypothetical protein ACSHX3_05735 [Litorimonas sp.]